MKTVIHVDWDSPEACKQVQETIEFLIKGCSYAGKDAIIMRCFVLKLALRYFMH